MRIRSPCATIPARPKDGNSTSIKGFQISRSDVACMRFSPCKPLSVAPADIGASIVCAWAAEKQCWMFSYLLTVQLHPTICFTCLRPCVFARWCLLHAVDIHGFDDFQTIGLSTTEELPKGPPREIMRFRCCTASCLGCCRQWFGCFGMRFGGACSAAVRATTAQP